MEECWEKDTGYYSVWSGNGTSCGQEANCGTYKWIFRKPITEDFIEVQDKWLDGGSSKSLQVISEESVEKN
jgi:hypothetical protein